MIEATDAIPGETVFARGTSVGQAWKQLCDTGTLDIVLPPIYDPINRPGKVTEVEFLRQAGVVRYSAIMAWDKPGRNVTEASRLVDGTRLVNRAQFYAGQAGKPVALQSDAASIATYGEYWSLQDLPGRFDSADLVELYALAQVETRANGARNLTFSPAPERSLLCLRDYGLGDFVPVWSSRRMREPLEIDYDAFDPAAPGASGYQRIGQIPINLDDNGVERPQAISTYQDVASGVA